MSSKMVYKRCVFFSNSQMLKFWVKGACSRVGIKFCFFFEFVLKQGGIYELVAFACGSTLPEALRLFFFPEAVDPSIFEKIMFAKNLRKFFDQGSNFGQVGKVEIINRKFKWRLATFLDAI